MSSPSQGHGQKLSGEQVLAIREKYAGNRITQRELGKLYGVSQPVIGDIVRGDSWVHIGGPRIKFGRGRR